LISAEILDERIRILWGIGTRGEKFEFEYLKLYWNILYKGMLSKNEI